MKPIVLTISLSILLTAGSRESPARSRGDTQEAAVKRFWRCLRGHHCSPKQVFQGPKALLHWQRQNEKRKRFAVKLARAELIRTMTDAKWQERWKAAIKRFAAAGYKASALSRLGSGRAIVQAGPREAIALTRTAIKAAGQTRTTVLLMVLWRVGARWRVASWECNPSYLLGFMLKHKPR